MAAHDAAHARFWELAEPWLAHEDVERGTMMDFPCLRRSGAFFACVERDGDGLIAKLSREWVAALVASGAGEPFAPAGRVFREWVRVPWSRSGDWEARIAEAWAFAG